MVTAIYESKTDQVKYLRLQIQTVNDMLFKVSELITKIYQYKE